MMEDYHLGSCQNCGPLLGTLNDRRRIIIDPSFDNHPSLGWGVEASGCRVCFGKAIDNWDAALGNIAAEKLSTRGFLKKRV